MKTLGEIGHTDRGFERIEFYDRNDQLCSLQQSSAAIEDGPPGSSALWLGIDGERMHLDREQVAALVAHLSAWLQTGSFAGGAPPEIVSEDDHHRAIVDCPYGEPLHYHHDGCPSCLVVVE